MLARWRPANRRFQRTPTREGLIRKNECVESHQKEIALKYLVLLVVLASLLPQAATASQDADDLKPYPAAQEGSVRTVFRVPALENEADRKVEILIGVRDQCGPENDQRTSR